MRQRHIRLYGTEVKVDCAVVMGIQIGFQLHPVLLARLCPEELPSDLIAGKNRGSYAELRAHVGDGRSFRHREAGDARAAVFNDSAHVALGSQALQQLKNDVLRRNPRLKFAVNIDARDLGIGQEKRASCHGDRHVQSSGADGQHADRARRRGVAIAADQGPPRPAQPFEMNLMADSIAWFRVQDSVLRGHRLQIFVIVGILEALLQCKVVDVRYGKLCPDFFDPHGLELQIGHGAERVLSQRLVYLDADLATRLRLSRNQMRGDQLFHQIQTHAETPFSAFFLSRAVRMS